MLTGSWEDQMMAMQRQVCSFMEKADVEMDDCWCYITSTFDDHIIACCEKYEYGGEDEYTYYKVSWANENGKPKLSGSPKAVEVVVTAEEMEERAASKLDRKVAAGLANEPEALEPTVTELAGAFLAKSSPEDRARLLKALETIKQVEANNELAEQYRALQ